MLSIYFGYRDDMLTNTKSVFKRGDLVGWLNDPLVKRMIKDIDNSEVLSPYCIESPVLGQIAPERLSGGVQVLILMLKTDFIINASKCGDNCAKWILKIAEIKDLTICLNHPMNFGTDSFCANVLNDGTKIKCFDDYVDCICRFL